MALDLHHRFTFFSCWTCLLGASLFLACSSDKASTGDTESDDTTESGGSKTSSTKSGSGGTSKQSSGSGGSAGAKQGSGGSSGGGKSGAGGSAGSAGKQISGSGGAAGKSGGAAGATNRGGSNASGAGGSSKGAGGSNVGAAGSTTGTGGTTGGAGTSTQEGGGAGSASSGTNPAGYFTTKDWNVTSVDWHGCVWTGVDSTVSGSTTKISPQDFTAETKAGGPYHVSGSVFNSYEAVALLGFNLNEASTGNATQCKYNASAASSEGPPTVTIPSSATGMAISWSQAKAPPSAFRIQLQAADGATNADHRWCATITDPGGPSFVKFSDFYTKCWNVGGSESPGNAYKGEPVDAVVFLVPGTTAQQAPFDFTINGFAPGTSAADAPAAGSATCGTTSGTIGSTTASDAASMQRAKVSGTDCKQYIVQNNNWGNKTGSTQVLNYVGNSFTVVSSSGTGSSAPASFPSIYIGANGNLSNGTYDTRADSGLPAKIGSIASAQTSFTWSGGTNGGSYNATYDVWFAKSQPPATYEDAISGFLMVWLYKPSDKSPIGVEGKASRKATVANRDWDVWVGPRATTSAGTDDAKRPVVSYVATTTLSSFSFDLKAFMDDAVKNAEADQKAGGTSQAFSSDWLLTDVFGGFEIWNGSQAKGLKAEFSCVIK